MKPVLKQNSQKLELLQGGFNGYRLLTDGDGEVFYQQAVGYMRETLGSQGVQILLEKLKDQEEKTDEAQKRGEQSENGGSLDSYDSEISNAAQKSEEAKNNQENQKDQGDFGDGGSGEDFTGGADTTVENPIPVIRRVRKMGLLDLVVPAERGISDASTDRRTLAVRYFLYFRNSVWPVSAEKTGKLSKTCVFGTELPGGVYPGRKKQ